LTPLHLAALDEFCDVAYTLLWYGANTHIQDYEGDTPLHIAHNNCSEITIQHLLDFEADITIKNNKDISYEDIMKYELNDEDDIDE
jgi:ankyrin repeat protein